MPPEDLILHGAGNGGYAATLGGVDPFAAMGLPFFSTGMDLLGSAIGKPNMSSASSVAASNPIMSNAFVVTGGGGSTASQVADTTKSIAPWIVLGVVVVLLWRRK